jgi:hypothetical protein
VLRSIQSSSYCCSRLAGFFCRWELLPDYPELTLTVDYSQLLGDESITLYLAPSNVIQLRRPELPEKGGVFRTTVWVERSIFVEFQTTRNSTSEGRLVLEPTRAVCCRCWCRRNSHSDDCTVWFMRALADCWWSFATARVPHLKLARGWPSVSSLHETLNMWQHTGDHASANLFDCLCLVLLLLYLLRSGRFQCVLEQQQPSQPLADG